jgi:hypothetical protein
MPHSGSLTLEQAKDYISQIDFNPVLNKLAKQRGWSYSSALLACEQYKRYLFLQRKFGSEHVLAPSKDKSHNVTVLLYHLVLPAKYYSA